MDRRFKNYQRRKFNQWRDKVKKHLPEMVTKFYSIEKYIDYDYHKQLGRVILNTNNPFYTLVDHSCNNTNYENEMCLQILLEIDVKELFRFININCNKNQ